ncbi:mitochondrial carrier domain-containing protein [Obelidium mucronatum]|nr:mitochondrial carrier domain-containing protein [Obelidium mucronatum]
MTSNTPSSSLPPQVSETVAFVKRTLDSDQVRSFTRPNGVIIASTCSAVASVVAGYPFDLIKTRMQAFRYPSNMACIKEIYTLDGGLVGFFRGMGPILLTVSILRSVSFSAYTTVKPLLMEELSDEGVKRNLQATLDALQLSHIRPEQLTLPKLDLIDWAPIRAQILSHLSPEAVHRLDNLQTPTSANIWSSIIAGSCAGSIVATLNAPLEFIKIQRQLDTKVRHSAVVTSSTLETMVESSAGAVASGTAGGLGEGAAVASITQMKEKRAAASATSAPPKHKHLSAWDWGKRIVRQKGFLGLYSGYSYHLIRDATGTGMYFGGYEAMKVLFTPKNEIPGPMVHMMAGGLSGTLSWIVLYPIDLIKSVMQKEALQVIPKYTSAREFISRRYKRGGIRGFYHGIGAQLMRSFPVHAMNFLIYEAVLKWCRR